MLAAFLILLERCGQEEDRLAVLDRGDAAHGEGLAVAGAVHVVDDRRLDVARAQEVGVDRVHVALAVGVQAGAERLLRGRQGLAQHLAAEDVLGADVAALAAEEVVLEALEAEQVDQFGDDGNAHGDS